MSTDLLKREAQTAHGASSSSPVIDHVCSRETINPCNVPEPCVSVVTPDGAHVCPIVSDHSSSDCQWSTEEHILQRLYEAEGSKLDAAFFYSGMHDAPVLRSPYFYESYDYEYGFPHSSMPHSPNVNQAFSRHHAKLTSDPTILLTLVRWARIGSSRLTGDDDAVDRLNYQFTTLIILLLITLTGVRQYLSHLPLQCWIPQEFSRSWEEYAEHYCWVTNTYFSDVQARLPPPEERKNVVRYYQWATFVLGLQAAGFFLPCIVWRLLQNYSGFQVKRIMHGVMQLNFAPPSTVARTVRGIAHYMDAVIYHRKYKFWQKLQDEPKQKRFQSQKSRHQASERPPTFNQTSEAVKVVQFRKNGSGNTSTRDTCIVTEAGLSSSHKKRPAPSPPRETRRAPVRLCSARTQNGQPSISRCAAHSACCSPDWCNLCNLCFAAEPAQRRVTERQTQAETVQPLIPSTSKADKESVSTKHVGCGWCCASRHKPSKTKASVPLMQPEGKTIHVQLGRESSRTKGFYRLFCNTLCFSGRLILTLICLIPGCLCHCLRGTHKTKCVQRSNSFLFYLYVTIKLLYLFNLIGQLYFMKIFLDTESHFFGFYVLRDLIRGRMWTQTGNFPRVTYCDFEAKKTGKNYKYTLQCVLPLNLFLEKIYIFLWFWMIFVAIMTTYSLFKWLSRLSIPQSRYRFVQKFLIPWKLPDGCEELNRQAVKMFIEHYLDLNGVFILWLSANNAGELVSGELIAALWDLFRRRLMNVQSASQSYLLDESHGHLHCFSGAFERCSRDDLGRQRTALSPKRTHITFVEEESWKPSHLYMGNAIPAYCTMPKRRVSKPRAPDIPAPQIVTRKPPRPSSSTFHSSPVFFNPNVDDYQMEKCAIDSSLDSIV